jgi:acylglycerol lipase
VLRRLTLLCCAAGADKTLKLYQGHYHEVFNDLGFEKVIADVVTWIQARMPQQV